MSTGESEQPSRQQLDDEKTALYAMDISGVTWVGYGEDTTGEGIVETAELPGGGMAMRNSIHPEGPILRFTEGEWTAFVLGVRDGEFDLDRLAEPLPEQRG
ncbi:DUF397 domain-containing protein [Embleya sp. NBC_00896]|uniref:DUF397 domain-containing protein n=1 Tax=Embleya sp. NBC_00896 TaxID=2975961 RepID=UPI0038653531|nr:DUF397 domain-containing protein [Embleya sp. NBC_00896]